MSADNWRTCLRCTARRDKAVTDMHAAASEGYGRLPVEEFDRLRSEADRLATAALPQEFREDYEIGVFDDGTFTVIYQGSCRDCGWKVEYKHEKPLDTSDAR